VRGGSFLSVGGEEDGKAYELIARLDNVPASIRDLGVSFSGDSFGLRLLKSKRNPQAGIDRLPHGLHPAWA